MAPQSGLRELFGDTFFWVALANQRDPYHAQVQALDRQLSNVRIVTTQEVLTEFLTFFAGFGPAMRRRAAQTVRALMSSTRVQVLEQSRASFAAGLALYEARPDKGYSLTDCISMHTMRDLGITDVLTNDHHFVQEGFVVLLAGAVP
jgi:predicted nucleic acid-binding protein